MKKFISIIFLIDPSFKPTLHNYRKSKRNNSSSEDPADIVQSSEDENRERQETGVVKSDIYLKYWLAVGVFLSPAILLSLTFMQATRNFSDVW